MNITHFELYRFDLTPKSSFAISFDTVSTYHNYLIRLASSDPAVEGWGEGAPFKAITGDSQEEAIAEALELKELPAIGDSTKIDRAFLGRIQSPSLRAAFDFALHDLQGRISGMPVYQLYSTQARLVPNSVTVFLKANDEETAAETVRIADKYPSLRVLKIKLKGEGDVARCRAIRKVAPQHWSFMLDANQGFPDPLIAADTLREIIAVLGEVILIEEPCPKGSYEKMRTVQERIEVPVFADESCTSLADLERLSQERCVRGINIKLQKTGGIAASRALAMEAERRGLAVMVGQMFEAQLSTSASVHCASTLKNVVVTDLDMDLELPTICEGGSPFANGHRVPGERPGIGCVLNPSALEALQREGSLCYERLR